MSVLHSLACMRRGTVKVETRASVGERKGRLGVSLAPAVIRLCSS